MPAWSGNKVNPTELNSGNEFTENDQVAIEELNAMVNGGLYAQNFAEALADTPDNSEANNVGIASVELIDNIKGGKTYKKFKFKNLKGQTGATGSKGDTGLTPDIQIGTVTTLETGQPASASMGGTVDNPLLNLGLPKGNTGTQGAKGETGVSYRARGVWSNASTYLNNSEYIDTVQFNGSTYYAKANNTNNPPSDGVENAVWGVLALKGSDSGVDIVQETGSSTTSVMSQDAVSKLQTYDLVISTQQEFENMLSSPNWLGASRVGIRGDFYRYGYIEIPNNVSLIHGIGGNATIQFLTGTSYSTAGLGYSYTYRNREIKNITVQIYPNLSGPLDSGTTAFTNFNNLYNCSAIVSAVGVNRVGAIGFRNCTNLVGCRAEVGQRSNGADTSDRAIGFSNCTQVVNCISELLEETGSLPLKGVGYYNCSYGSNNKFIDHSNTSQPAVEGVTKWSADSNDV